MDREKHTTVNLTKKAQVVKEDLAPVFGLKNILSAGLLLFGSLTADEQKTIIAKANGASTEKQQKMKLDSLHARLFQLDCDLDDVDISKDKKQVKSLRAEKEQVMRKIANLQAEMEKRARALRKVAAHQKEELSRPKATRRVPPASPSGQ